PRAEAEIGLDGRRLQLLDRLIGEVGGADQIGHHLPQRVAVLVQALEALVEQDAIADCQREQNRHGAFNQYSKREPEHHRPSIVSSIASKAAMVTLGGLSGLVTRTET